MSLVEQNTNNAPTVEQTNKPKVPKDRFVLGGSESYFEVAQNLTGEIKASDLDRLFINENMTIGETEGRSLKVLFNTGTETRFIGFITAGDASISLDEEDIPRIKEAVAQGTIARAIDIKKLVSLF